MEKEEQVFQAGRKIGREEAGGLRKESFKSRVVWLIFVKDV
jgi:hypothetical protein